MKELGIITGDEVKCGVILKIRTGLKIILRGVALCIITSAPETHSVNCERRLKMTHWKPPLLLLSSSPPPLLPSSPGSPRRVIGFSAALRPELHQRESCCFVLFFSRAVSFFFLSFSLSLSCSHTR